MDNNNIHTHSRTLRHTRNKNTYETEDITQTGAGTKTQVTTRNGNCRCVEQAGQPSSVPLA